VGLFHSVKIEQPAEVALLDADPVSLYPADLGAGPAQLPGYLIPGQAGALAEAAQFGG